MCQPLRSEGFNCGDLPIVLNIVNTRTVEVVTIVTLHFYIRRDNISCKFHQEHTMKLFKYLSLLGGALAAPTESTFKIRLDDTGNSTLDGRYLHPMYEDSGLFLMFAWEGDQSKFTLDGDKLKWIHEDRFGREEVEAYINDGAEGGSYPTFVQFNTTEGAQTSGGFSISSGQLKHEGVRGVWAVCDDAYLDDFIDIHYGQPALIDMGAVGPGHDLCESGNLYVEYN